ncbi:hypothetical protein CsSME_00005284 [Camellia sinensis var. sinensis]
MKNNQKVHSTRKQNKHNKTGISIAHSAQMNLDFKTDTLCRTTGLAQPLGLQPQSWLE